ncbi:hypothetical protein ACC687_40955, partial [Rhizobium ruizarguesonis]
SSRFRISAWTETSSADVGSSSNRMLIMKNGCFVDELTKADLQAGTTHDAYARELFEESFIEA